MTDTLGPLGLFLFAQPESGSNDDGTGNIKITMRVNFFTAADDDGCNLNLIWIYFMSQ